jgi:WD40 repeat protein/mono/diheme cytochrome c family protein
MRIPLKNLSLTTIVCLLVTPMVVGQSKTKAQKPVDAHRLESLLRELDGIDPKVWQQRIKILKDQAQSYKKRAKSLIEAAGESERRAKSVEREIQRMERLQKLLVDGKPSPKRTVAKPTTKPAPKVKAKKPLVKPAPKPSAKKPTAKPAPKMVAKKPLAKPSPKPSAKKPTAKPAPKMVVKKPLVKQAPKPSAKKPTAKPAPKVKAKKPLAKPAPKPSAKKPTAKPAPKMVAKKPLTKLAPKPIAKKLPAKAAPKATAKKPSAKPMKKAPAMVLAANPDLEVVTYDDHIQDIFMNNCAGCHDPDERKGGLDLTTFASARAGGASGTTIIPGDAELSRLYLLVSHQEKPTMPPQEPKIADEKIQLIRKWILGGAPESKADGQAFAAKQKKAQSHKGVAMVASFDKPAPLPSNWHVIEPTPTLRSVAVTSIATSNRSELVAIPGLRQVFMLDTKTRKTLGVLPFVHGDVEVIRFSADCSQLLVGGGIRGKRGRVSLFNIADGKLVGSYGAEYDSVLAAALHPQLTHVAMGGPKKRVRVFDVSTGKQAYEVKDHNDWILGISFSSNGKLLASGSRDGSIVITRNRDGRNIHTIQRNQGAVQQVIFSPDSSSLAAIGDDRTLRMFELGDAKQLWQRSLSTPPKALAFSFDGRYLATGGTNGQATIHDARRGGAPVATLPNVGDWIYSLAFDKDGKQLFVGNWQGATTVFDIKTKKRIATLTPSRPKAIGKSSGQ